MAPREDHGAWSAGKLWAEMSSHFIAAGEKFKVELNCCLLT